MGIVSNVGLGSGLNITELVGQLVESERAGPSLIINRKEARAKSQISALATLRSAFSTLQTSLNALKDPALFDNRSLTSADTTRLNVRATGTTPAALGSIQIEIEALAEGQKLRTAAPIADADAAIGTGTLRFATDGESFDVTIDSTNNSLRGLANAINKQSAGKGVQASLVLGDGGYNLVLSAVKTGSEGTVTVSQIGGSNLSAFTSAELDTVTPAADAVFYVDGLKRTSSSNIITDAVQGIELTLVKAEVGETVTVTVGQDTGTASRAVQSFVTAYNAAIDAIASTTAYNADTQVAAALNGDGTIRAAGQQLRTQTGAALSALAKSGIDIGLETQLDGKLKFTQSSFSAAYAASGSQVEALFDGEDGAIYANLGATVSALASDNGNLARRNDQLDATVKQAGIDRTELDARMAVIGERYRTRFIALDVLISKLSSTGEYLSKQLASLPSANN